MTIQRFSSRCVALAVGLAILGAAGAAAADPVAKPPPAPPPPYSIPWQLRPVPAVNVLRWDTAFARYEDSRANAALTVATLLTAAARIPGTGPPTAGLSLLLRLGMVTDVPALGARGGSVLTNPLVGASWALKTSFGLRFNAFLGLTLPLGGGGGDTPNPDSLAARQRGLTARAQMDNALFAVNDATVIPGLSVAWVGKGVTVQGEITLLHLMRVRGESVQGEATKTNLTMGLHVGYFVVPQLSIGAELRYQRWLNAPFAVEKDATGASEDNLTFAIGLRGHFKLAKTVWIRPGMSYGRGLDKPMAAATPNYHIVQLDVPFLF